MSYVDSDPNEAALRARIRERRVREKAEERRQWAEYQRTYERCKLIAETVWQEELEKAAAQQQTLATEMRDREPLWGRAAACLTHRPASSTAASRSPYSLPATASSSWDE